MVPETARLLERTWAMTEDREGPRLYFDNAGHLCLDFSQGWREPVCPECHEPIRWALDMSSFTSGPGHQLAHARCVWTREGFRREAKLASDHE
jgi:hypothetical protein